MIRDVMRIHEIDQTHVALVGGKAANLGELARIEGIRVPTGFCVTTHVFTRILAGAPEINGLLDRISALSPAQREPIRTLSAEIRRVIEGIAIPGDLAEAIGRELDEAAATATAAAYAVRSSATAEDLPTASFAGQQDTYLNVVGREAILQRVRQCWASLFTERAVTYRLRNGIDQRWVRTAVIVQRMVVPHVSGVLFTADPVSGNRRVSSIDASFGLGEALVSGLVNPDVFKVRNGEVIAKTIAAKQLAIVAAPAGGVQHLAIDSERQALPALTDAQAVRLAELGRRIEAHFGRPQDIEWCLVDDDDIQIVQSRPITTLFPIPAVADGENHVFLSTGHQQMMTDAISPLGISLYTLTAFRPMAVAGGRLFVDVTQALASPAMRTALLETVGKGDPHFSNALQTIIDRGDFIRTLPDAAPAGPPPGGAPSLIPADPAIPARLIADHRASIAALERDIQGLSGPALLDAILADIHELRRILFDRESMQALMAGIDASNWLNERMQAWLGEQNAADALTQSAPNNVTSEMGLALLDVADAVRPHPEVIALLERVEGEGFLDELPTVAGGRAARDAIQSFLEQYGMRCPGEIDIARPRWNERPSALVPMILSNVRNFAPGEHARRFEQGRREAEAKEQDLLQRLRALPDGDEKAAETKQMIDLVRAFIGYREYPKYSWVSRYAIYKRAFMQEAARLVQAGVLQDPDDIFFLDLHELLEAARTNHVDGALIRARKEEFAVHQALTPPRVLTSDGEGLSGSIQRDDLPEDALVGLAVSGGTVEGRARVILDMAAADLAVGDILVTRFTDPSWTPLFVAIAGLVTEVGGLMTHGAVIAREYGLPAVIGVERATERIADGQRIRVHGADGYVELLSE